MKKCPFCAEEIQDEAIKCRHCGSFLSAAPPAGAAPAATPTPPPSAMPTPVAAAEVLRPAAVSPPAEVSTRRVLYSGSPSWRAYFGEYFLFVVGTLVVAFVAFWLTGRLAGTSASDPAGAAGAPGAGAGVGVATEATGASTLHLALAIAIPLAIGAVAVAALHIYRRSKIFRITTSNIESESGLLSKKIDVLELWRCRDVRYVQSVMDRIFGIAHIEITTTDVSTPQLTLVGLPASRQLFEQIRDSIELQRQSRNVVGMVH